jgi:Ca2+-binding EF-hand superfamily protein
MTRKKINVALADKGFVDPLIAQCCQHLAKAKDACGLTFEQLYGIFAGTAAGALTKENFITCAQGLELDIAVEDLLELFNSMDEEGNNVIGQVAFVDMLTNVTSKMGGQGFLDAQMGKGASKKASTNRTATLVVLNQVADAILKKQLQMRQVIQVLDINKTGFITRAEFAQIIRGLCEKITRKQELMLTEFFERGAGVSVTEMVALLQDLINQ